MAHATTHAVKTCSRCGRTGSHAFRRTADGLDECSTVTACRARVRRAAGIRGEGRGRLPKRRAATMVGVAYVIGARGDARRVVERTLRDGSPLSVAVGDAGRATLAAMGLRNVKILAVDAACLSLVGFRNEFDLRRQQPQLHGAALVIYGSERDIELYAARGSDALLVSYRMRPEELGARLRRQLRALLAGRNGGRVGDPEAAPDGEGGAIGPA